jgi:hypothetical protein
MVDNTDTAANKRYEARLRRLATRMGLALQKSRTRDPNMMDFGCYRIVNAQTGKPVAGTYPFAYSLDLQRAEEALKDLQENPLDLANASLDAPVAPAPGPVQAHGCAGGDDPRWQKR